MKKKLNWTVITAVLLAAVLTPLAYHRLTSPQAQRHLQHRLADARTVVAAVRYLMQPEFPDFQQPKTAWVSAQPAAPNSTAEPLSHEYVPHTNLTSLTASNGIAAKPGEATVPG